MPLPVGGAFHTPLMAAARDRLRKAIDATESDHAKSAKKLANQSFVDRAPAEVVEKANASDCA